ncbi:MAG: DUF2027 domain-containing protein [Alloprevotella sp.]|nr:DUF2027 domain-containing protein [Alloprevotella sp.]
MKIGDKVRFLNDVGGGVVTGFQGKDVVLVTDEDGFEVPTLVKDVVVIETDNYNIPKKALKPKKKALPEASPDAEEEPEEADLADLPLNYKPLPRERRGAEELNLFLAFVPKRKGQVPAEDFEIYLVNDCNYYVRFALFLTLENVTALRHEGELAPNTKLPLETLASGDLQVWEHVLVQALSYKRDKACKPKLPVHVPLRLDLSKCYKSQAYRESPFFTSPAVVYDLVRDDKPVRGLQVDADALAEAMQTPAAKPARAAEEPTAAERRAAAKRDPQAPLEVDLHAHSLLDTLVGLQPVDILDYQLKVFRDVMEQYKRRRGQRIVFIHGKGNGVLRKALLHELQTRYPEVRCQDASFREYGYGATLVTL